MYGISLRIKDSKLFASISNDMFAISQARKRHRMPHWNSFLKKRKLMLYCWLVFLDALLTLLNLLIVFGIEYDGISTLCTVVHDVRLCSNTVACCVLWCFMFVLVTPPHSLLSFNSLEPSPFEHKPIRFFVRRSYDALTCSLYSAVSTVQPYATSPVTVPHPSTHARLRSPRSFRCSRRCIRVQPRGRSVQSQPRRGAQGKHENTNVSMGTISHT